MRWVYRVEDLTVPQQNGRDAMARQLDTLGEDGWEVVAVSATGPSPSGALQYRTIMKRARPEDGFGAVGIPVEDER